MPCFANFCYREHVLLIFAPWTSFIQQRTTSFKSLASFRLQKFSFNFMVDHWPEDRDIILQTVFMEWITFKTQGLHMCMLEMYIYVWVCFMKYNRFYSFFCFEYIENRRNCGVCKSSHMVCLQIVLITGIIYWHMSGERIFECRGVLVLENFHFM